MADKIEYEFGKGGAPSLGPNITIQKERQSEIVARENSITEEELKQYDAELKKVYSDQCLLMTFAARLQQMQGITKEDQSEYAIIDGDPGLIITHLTANKSINEFLTITPAQLSSLVPKIEIYKVFYDKQNEGEDFLFTFPTHTHIENLTSNKFYRGDGAGIKDLEVTLEGKTPATRNHVDVRLNLYFQDIKYFFAPQKHGAGRNISFAHLITYPGIPGKEREDLDTDHFRIKMVAGWQIPKDTKLISPELQRAIKDTQLVMMLDLIDHEINFSNDGSVNLGIHYRGAIENAFNSNHADIMALEENSINKLKSSKEKIKKMEESVKKMNEDLETKAAQLGADDHIKYSKGKTSVSLKPGHFIDQRKKMLRGEIDTKNQQISSIKSANQSLHIQHFFADIGKSSLYFFDVSEGEINVINSAVTALNLVEKADENKPLSQIDASLDAKVKEIFNSVASQQRVTSVPGGYDATAAASEDAKKNEEAQGMQARNEIDNANDAVKKQQLKRMKDAPKWSYTSRNNDNIRRISFIKLGDIINNLLKKVGPDVRENLHLKNLTVLMGPIRFRDLVSRRVLYLNLAEVPIDVRVFNKFLTEKVVGEGRKSYSFQQFLEDLINELVHVAFDSCSGISQGNAATLNILPFSVPGGPKGAGRVKNGEKISSTSINFNKAPHASVKNVHNYLILYASDWAPPKLHGRWTEDLENNIYHFVVGGPDSGILKNIAFSQNSNPTWNVATYMAASGEEGEPRVSGVVKPQAYNATITTVGNTLFQLGQQVYIDTTFIDGGFSAAYKLAFGGYYSITKIKSSFTPVRYDTTIQAILTVPDWSVRNKNSHYQASAPTQLVNSTGAPTTTPEKEIGKK